MMPRSESELILDFFDTEDLMDRYEIYQQFRDKNYTVASEMRRIIEEQVKNCPGYSAWRKEVVNEEVFSDFSTSQL